MKAFGAQVRRLREARGLSQEELAESAGAHRNYVGGVERGEYNLSLISMAKIANGLGVRVVDLVVELPAYEPSPDDRGPKRKKRRGRPSG